MLGSMPVTKTTVMKKDEETSEMRRNTCEDVLEDVETKNARFKKTKVKVPVT